MREWWMSATAFHGLSIHPIRGWPTGVLGILSVRLRMEIQYSTWQEYSNTVVPLIISIILKHHILELLLAFATNS